MSQKKIYISIQGLLCKVEPTEEISDREHKDFYFDFIQVAEKYGLSFAGGAFLYTQKELRKKEQKNSIIKTFKIMRKPSCEATIKASKEVQAMSPGEVDEILTAAPTEVKITIAALLIAFPKGNKTGELDDWECDLWDVLYKEIKS